MFSEQGIKIKALIAKCKKLIDRVNEGYKLMK